MTESRPYEVDFRDVAPLHEVAGLARTWVEDAKSQRMSRSAHLLAGLLSAQGGLAFLTHFVDSVVRPEDPRVAASALRALSGSARGFLPPWQVGLLRLGGAVGRVFPRLVVGVTRLVVRSMVAHLIVDASPLRLTRAFSKLRSRGSHLNVNLLGEAVLGVMEADKRLERTIALIRRADVDYVSLKVSAAVPPHNPWAFDNNVEHIVGRLERVFVEARDNGAVFVNLDMEEYRDLDLTLDVFTRLLDREQFLGLSAGVVLQAYLPDSAGALERLTQWALSRVARGGAPIKVRLVKGANLAMERVDAEIHGWPLATWHTKAETDAHYKRLLHYALTPERTAAVRIGVAGHNLFDVAHALLLARARGVDHAVEFEMLLGMGEHLAAAVAKDTGPLRLYTPVVHGAEFDVALAYLVRRLEEVASKDNFMSAVYDIGGDNALFAREQARYIASLELLHAPHAVTHRVPRTQVTAGGFANTPDSDPAVADTRAWALDVVTRAQDLTLGAQTAAAGRCETSMEVAQAVAAAHEAAPAWAALPARERAAVLDRAADELERRRADLIAVMMSEAHKTLDQADVEVSEVVDFARYYGSIADGLDQTHGASIEPRGVTLIAPPWNFPVAIPGGSTIAALASGSSAILKPSELTPRCAAVLAEALWAAGVPRQVLTLIDIDPEVTGDSLISDARVDQVILTGSYETAERMLGIRPTLRLGAETSGKNSIIVTASADMDLAVKDVVASAFGHQGQKCSAASLVILVGSVGHSRRFMAQLTDAVTSLKSGVSTDLSTQVAPLADSPSDRLERGLTSLDPGESWLVEPRVVNEGENHWTPGVRRGVARGSFFHLTECFGPVLGIMTAASLDEAISMANDVEFGLTSGIHSLDEREVAHWIEGMRAGNLYVNRGITGAIVRRQPFGGWKRSVVGATSKAGGPHYVASLAGWVRSPLPDDAPVVEPSDKVNVLLDEGMASQWVRRAAAADEHAWRERFSRGVDVTGLACEANVMRYVPAEIDLRWEDGASFDELLRVLAAARRAGAYGVLSTEQRIPIGLGRELLAAGIDVRTEQWDSCVARVVRRGGGRIRVIGAPRRTAPANVAVFDGAVTANPDLELLPFLWEQSVTVTTHRFGRPYAPMLGLVERLKSPRD